MSQQGAGADEALAVVNAEEEAVAGLVIADDVALAGLVGPVVAPPQQRIVIAREYGLDIVELLARPGPRWAARLGPDGQLVPQLQTELSEDEMRNGFQLNLAYSNLKFVPERARSIVVYGRESIEQVSTKVFRALEATDVWDHGRAFAVFFSTLAPKYFIPAGTLVGEILRSNPNEDKISLTLDCLLAEPNELHGRFGIVPPAGVA